MKLLQSKLFDLPKVYFISDRKKIAEIPPGVPFIYGDAKMEKNMIRVLEYEVLYQEALKSGYPFNFAQILRDNGFTDIRSFGFSIPTWIDFKSDRFNIDEDLHIEEKMDKLSEWKGKSKFIDYVKDSVVYVDIQKLKDLKVFPIWLNTIEEAISTNVHNFAVYNENMYNKKLEGMFGSLDMVSPPRNLIIIDISGSIPKGVSSTCLTLSKNLAESFFADLLITGSKSTLYPYEILHEIDVEFVYEENGMDNDQVYFRKLLTDTERKYRTAIIFGDNHSPCHSWNNTFNRNTRKISREDGRKMCKWQVEKIISFHTNSEDKIAGYGDWFTPKKVEHVKGWVKYL